MQNWVIKIHVRQHYIYDPLLPQTLIVELNKFCAKCQSTSCYSGCYPATIYALDTTSYITQTKVKLLRLVFSLISHITACRAGSLVTAVLNGNVW